MINLNLKKNTKKSGFTLLEALVAISILMVAVAAPITIAQKGLSSASYSKNQLIASYLAQDAIEYLINKRDGVTINESISHDWGALWSNPDFMLCTSNDGCQIDTNLNGGAGGIMSGSSSKVLNKSVDGFYGFGGDPTIFTRIIKVNKVSGDDNSALITAMVSWGTDSVTVKTLIYNY